MDRTRVVIASGLAVALLVGVIVVSLVFRSGNDQAAQTPPPAPVRTGPVALVPVPAPAAASADCATLVQNLPPSLPTDSAPLTRATLAEPAPPATAAWSDQRSDPVVLRCGLEKPAELTPTSQLGVINGVSWLETTSTDSTTWYLADRSVYVALTIPRTAGTGPLQDISTFIGKTLARRTS